MKPWDAWSFDVDYWHFTFDDQISIENAVELARNPATVLDPNKIVRNPAAGTVLSAVCWALPACVGQAAAAGVAAAHVSTAAIRRARMHAAGRANDSDLRNKGRPPGLRIGTAGCGLSRRIQA